MPADLQALYDEAADRMLSDETRPTPDEDGMFRPVVGAIYPSAPVAWEVDDPAMPLLRDLQHCYERRPPIEWVARLCTIADEHGPEACAMASLPSGRPRSMTFEEAA